MDLNRIKICDECKSNFYNDPSEMENLCPECSNFLYGYPNCKHNFIENRYEKCNLNGKTSKYIKKLKAGK